MKRCPPPVPGKPGRPGAREMDGGEGYVSTQKVIVVRMAADPKPQHAIWNCHTQGTIRKPDAHRPKPANFLEMQGWVMGVVFQQDEAFAGKFLNRLGQGPI